MRIDEVDPAIKAFHKDWKLNRDFVEGERAVNPAGKAYLPCEAGLKENQYLNIVTRTPFFPGAARTHEGLVGLIFRKAATVTAPDNLRSILETITSDYLTIDDLAEEVASEHLITNFTGLLVDQPVATGLKTIGQAEQSGERPFVAVYRAESIIGVERGIVNNRVELTRVRIQDDDWTIRELRLDDGRYTVTLWTRPRDGGDYTAGDTIVPTRNGQPLPAIPFTLISTNRRAAPAKARIHDICRLNAQHYIASSNLAQCDFFVSHPTPYLFGPAKLSDLSLAPGSFISGEIKSGNDVRIGMLEYSGSAIRALADRCATLKSDMAKIGSRILADEKSAVEAAETLAIKTASENAALASTARLISRKITDALKWVSWWMNQPEDTLKYEANTDYGDAKLSREDVDVRFGLYQSGVISRDAFLDILIEGEVLPESYDRDADADRIAEEVADRPTAMTTSPDNDATS